MDLREEMQDGDELFTAELVERIKEVTEREEEAFAIMGGYIDPETQDLKEFSKTELEELKKRFRKLAENKVYKELKEMPIVHCVCGCRIATPGETECLRCNDKEAS